MVDDKNPIDLGISGPDDRARDGEMENITPRNGSNFVKRDLQRRHIVSCIPSSFIDVP